jgi:RNA polymerase sigma factor (sigma-70 family)
VKRESFEHVVQRHGPTVLRVCRAVVGHDLAEDAWSETFVSAMRAYADLPPGSNVEAWLVTIAHRKALDQIRARNRRAIPTAELPEPASGTEDDIGPDLWEALARLPGKQRQTVAYHYLVGLPYDEVAEILGGTAAAARRAAADGITALRRIYVPAPSDDTAPREKQRP